MTTYERFKHTNKPFENKNQFNEGKRMYEIK
jgi:hypothetical protein